MRWSKSVCDYCLKRKLANNPNAVSCAFRSFDGIGSCYPWTPELKKEERKD